MNIVISNSSGEPIYLQIVNQIKRQILQKELLPGDHLPSIRQLALDLRVSVITTKRAYEQLEREGVIDSHVGRGSFVSGNNLDYLRKQGIQQLEDQIRQLLKKGKELELTIDEITDLMHRVHKEEQSE